MRQHAYIGQQGIAMAAFLNGLRQCFGHSAYWLKALLAVAVLFAAPVAMATEAADAAVVLQGDPDCGPDMEDYWQLDMTTGVSPISEEIISIHTMMMIVCAVIGVIVFGAMFFSIIFHRKGLREPASFHHNTLVELIWTIIPVAILVALAVIVVGPLLDQEDNSGTTMEIDVVAYQWLWEYRYPEENISFFSKLSETSNKKRILGAMPSDQAYDLAGEADLDCYLTEVDNRLVIPVDTKILMKVSSRDVAHAWSVDAFDFKVDAYPNIVNEKWMQANKVGVYRGWCKELCGRDHAFMPIVVEVKTQEDFAEWVKTQQEEQQAPPAEEPADNAANTINPAADVAVAGNAE